MTNILIADISDIKDVDVFLQGIQNQLSESRKNKILNYKAAEDKLRSAVCGLLLNYAYAQYCESVGKSICIPEEKQEKNKRPFIEGGFYYSVSHSGAWCMIIWSDKNCGADIQKVVSLKADIAGRFYNSQEKDYLLNKSEDEYKKTLFDIWTLKESFVKYNGRGMSYGFDRFSVISLLSEGKYDDGEYSFFGGNITGIEGYSLGYVAEEKCEKIEMCKVGADGSIRK